MEAAQIMPKPIPGDHDEVSSGQACIMQQKEQTHLSMWNYVSPDLNGVRSKNDFGPHINQPVKFYYDKFANDTAKKDTNKVNSTSNMTSNLVSPEARSGDKSSAPAIQSEVNRRNEKNKNHLMVVTPLNITTPTRAHAFPPSPMTGPLKSPFVSSMNLLDSKLASLKKSQYKLDDRIEQLNTWLDESGMEDSFDGELVFDEMDAGTSARACGTTGNLSGIGRQCGDEYDQKVFEPQANYCAQGTDDAGVHLPIAAQASDESFNRCDYPEVDTCLEQTSPLNDRVTRHIPRLSHRVTPSNYFDITKEGTSLGKSSDEVSASHSDSVLSPLRLYTTWEHQQPLDDSDHSCQVDSVAKQNTPIQEKSPSTELIGFESAANSQSTHAQNLSSDSICDTEHSSESESASEQHSVSDNLTVSSSARMSQTHFFSSNEARENQIFSTPFGRNVNPSLRGEINNIHGTSLNGLSTDEVISSTCECESICDSESCRSDNSEDDNPFHKERIHSTLVSTIDTPTISILARSAFSSDFPAKRILWSGESPLQMEASSDLNHIMSKLNLDPLSLHNTTSSMTPHPTSNNFSSMNSCNGKTSQQNRCSSPIKPKKLYNKSEDADSSFDEDENDIDHVVSVAPVTSQHSFIGEKHGIPQAEHQLLALATKLQWQLDDATDHHNITVEGASYLSSLFTRHVFADLSGARCEQPLASVAEMQYYAQQAAACLDADLIYQAASSPTGSSRLDFTSIGNTELVQQLLALVVKLQCKLTEAKAAHKEERDALVHERDHLIHQNQQYLTSKLESQALIDNLHTALASKDREINQLRIGKETIEAELNNFRRQSKDIEHVSTLMKGDTSTALANPRTHKSNVEESLLKTDRIEFEEHEVEQAIEPELLSSREISRFGGHLGESGEYRVELRQQGDQLGVLASRDEKSKVRPEEASECPSEPSYFFHDSPTHALPIGNHGAESLDAILSDENSSIQLLPRTSPIQEAACSPSVQISNLETTFSEVIQSSDQLNDLQRQPHERRFNDVSKEKDTAIAELEQTSGQLSLLVAPNESLSPTLVELQGNVSTVERQLLKLKAQADCLRERLRKTLSDKAHTESELNVAGHTIQSLNDKIQLLEKQEDDLVKKLELAEHQLNVTQNEIDLLSAERNKQEKKIEALQYDLLAIEDEKAKIEESLSSVTFVVDNLIGQKETTISSLHEEIISLKGEMSSTSERLENAENKLYLAISSNEHALNVVRELNERQIETSHCLSVALTERNRATADAQHQSSLLLAAKNELQSLHDTAQSSILDLNKQVDALSEELASKDVQIITLCEEKSIIEARLLAFHELQHRLVTEYKCVHSKEQEIIVSSLATVDQYSLPENSSSFLKSERIQDVERGDMASRALLRSLIDENARLFAENNRVRTRAAVLSVVALQLKMRSVRANNQERCSREKLDNAELSLAELNDDRRRLVEDSIALKEEIDLVVSEKEALLAKNYDCTAHTHLSKALVPNGDCRVEGVNCTTCTSAQHDVNREVCNQKLQSTIASLASALIKLKIREITVSKEKINLDKRLGLLQKQFHEVGEHLSKVVTQLDSFNDAVFGLKTELTEELQTLETHATQAVLKLLSKANRLKEKSVELQLEKEDLQSHNDKKEDKKLNLARQISSTVINELQSQRDAAVLKIAETVENKRTGQTAHNTNAEKLVFSWNSLSGDDEDRSPEKGLEFCINARNKPNDEDKTDFLNSATDASSRYIEPTSNRNNTFYNQGVAATRNQTEGGAAANTFVHHVVRCFSGINDRKKTENDPSPLDLAIDARNQELIELKQQHKALQEILASNEEDFAQTLSELQKSHQLKSQRDSELISNLKLENNALCELKQCLEHEKQASSLLRCELENVISEKDEMENSMKTSQQNMMHEMNCQLGTIASLKSEKESLTARLRECQVTTMRFAQKVKLSESETELAKKLRRQLESQLNERIAEADALKQTVTSKTARIEELDLKVRSLSQERDADRAALSAMHCEMKSLAAERDILSSQLTDATKDLNILRAEQDNLKHECHSSLSSSGNDCSVKTFGSCEYVGTICEESLPASPGSDIIAILSSPHISEEDIKTVRNKMLKFHSRLSQLQHERTFLKQEVKYLKTIKDSYEKKNQTHPADRKEVDMLLRKTSESYNLAKSQSEILRFDKELEARVQPRLADFTSPISVLPTSGNRPKFEVSLETPRVSNLVAKSNLRSSPRPRPKSKSPRSSNHVRSKERFEIMKGQSIFSMFRDTKKSGRKDKIKYREPNKDARSVDTEPLSPGEKRKREQAEQMMKSLRRRCEI